MPKISLLGSPISELLDRPPHLTYEPLCCNRRSRIYRLRSGPRLLADGRCVHVIDNLSTGNLDNLEEVADQITFHELDLCDYASIAPVIAGARRVFHLAALPSVPKSILDPVSSHETNINGTFNLFRAAVDGRVARVVYAASSSAYGDTEVLPKVETMRPQPKSSYAVQKLLGEYYASAFSSCSGLETVSLRFFNVFGPRQDPTSVYSGVLSIFLNCLVERRSPTIFGDGEQSRDFTYVEDVVALLIKGSEATGVSAKVFNTGNGNRYTLNQTWSLLQRVERVDLPLYGPPRGWGRSPFASRRDRCGSRPQPCSPIHVRTGPAPHARLVSRSLRTNSFR